MDNKSKLRVEKTKKGAILHIPVKMVIVGAILVVFVYFILLIATGQSRAMYRGIRLTATHQGIDAAVTQTISAINASKATTQPPRPQETATAIPPTPTPSSTPTPTLTIGSSRVSPIDGMVLLFVPEGSFMMGFEGGDASSKPVHEDTLDAFWIDQTEVTNSMYAQCVSAGVCSEPASLKGPIKNNYYGNSEFDDFPVIYVSWEQANDYCAWAGRQLPTEAQWEKAARGDDERLYPWGNTIEDYRGNFTPLKTGYRAVGSFQGGASPYGTLQMSGNAYEWVGDWFDKAYYQSQETWMNPVGPDAGEMRVIRGGKFFQWYYDKKIQGPAGIFDYKWERIYTESVIDFVSASRMYLNPESTSQLVGFRCAADAP